MNVMMCRVSLCQVFSHNFFVPTDVLGKGSAITSVKVGDLCMLHGHTCHRISKWDLTKNCVKKSIPSLKRNQRVYT